MDTNLRLEFKTSLTNTPVASHGPLFVTLIVNSIKSDTLTTPVVTLTNLVISKSTTGKAMTSSDFPLLLDSLVSFSVDVTLTVFGITPLAVTFATIYNTTVSLTFKLPIAAMPDLLS